MGIFRVDATGTQVRFNVRCLEVLGMTESETSMATWLAQSDPADAARMSAAREDTVRTRADLSIEFRWIRDDGTRSWVSLQATALPCMEGVTGFVGTLGDCTARKEDALSLERSREFVREVLASIPQPMFVKDSSHRWLMVNDAFAKLMGRRPEESAGRTDADILPPDWAERASRQDDEALASDHPLQWEASLDGFDGSDRWVISTTLKRNEGRLSIVKAIAGTMARSLPLDEVLRVAVNRPSLATDGVQARFLRLHHGHMQGTVHAAADGIERALEIDVVDLRLCPEYFDAIRTQEILVIGDLACDVRFSTMRAGLPVVMPGAVIDVPIRCGDTLTGVLRIETELPRPWSAHEKQIVAEAAEYIEVAWLQSQAAKERRVAEQALKKSETRLRLVNLVSKRVTEGDHVYNVLERAVDELQRGFPKARVTYWSSDEAHTLTAICCSAPPGSDNLVGERIDPRLDTTWAESLRQNRPVAFADLNAQMKSDSTSERTLASGAKSLLVMPLIRSGRLLGAISLSEPEPRIWLDNEVAMMGEISDALAVAVLSANVEQERRIAETARSSRSACVASRCRVRRKWRERRPCQSDRRSPPGC